VAVRVHGHDGCEVANMQMPHRFRNTELQQVNTQNLVDCARVELGRAADGVEIDSAALLQGRESLGSHAAFADYRTYAVLLDDGRLVRLLAAASGGPRGLDGPNVSLLQHNRTAVI